MRRFDVEEIRGDFPILSRRVHGRPLVYLDNAATAQKPASVIGAMDAVLLQSNGNIHRASHTLADEATAMYESAREKTAGFIGAGSSREVIFTSGATGGLNICARSLGGMVIGPGDNVIVSGMEHHSNIVPWQMVAAERGADIRVLPFDGHGVLELDRLERLIDDRTRILALTQCSNVLGTQPDVARAARIAHRHGVLVVVDGCQGVVHGGADVRGLGCDFYAFSGHKLYGPTGIGVLWGREELLERMPPVLGGGDMIKSVSFEGSTWADLPFKFEAGTANYVGAIGLAAAIDYLENLPAEEIAQHEEKLRLAAEGALGGIPGLRIYGSGPRKAPIVSFTVEGVHTYDLGVLLDRQGVAVRTGTHCAQPLVERFGVRTMCRASMAFYNTEQEIEEFVRALKKAITMLRR